MLHRLSIRAGLIVSVVAMGTLGLGLAVISGRIYRDQAIEAERAALVEQTRQRVDEVRASFERQAAMLARLVEATSAARHAEPLEQILTKLIDTNASDGVVALTLYDAELQPLSTHVAEGLEVPVGAWTTQCKSLPPPSTRGDQALPLRPLSSDCLLQRRLYYSVFVPIGERYLQVVFDFIRGLENAEHVLGTPLRVSLTSGTVLAESTEWAGAMSSADTLVAGYVLNVAVPREIPLLLQAAKDESVFYAKFERSRYAIFFASAAVALLGMLAALVLLERLAIAPLSNLLQQLRQQRADESRLGRRVYSDGNSEVVELASSFNHMTAKLEHLYEDIEKMSSTDASTQLPNRRYFHGQLTEAVARAQYEHKPFAVLIMDLDRFKEINDTLGHHIGDLLIQQVAARLRGKLRDTDLLARMGGDEFAVLLPAVTTKQADMAARMLLQSLRTPFVVEANELYVRASIGVALYPDHGVDVNTLIQRADVAMYAAKAASCGQAVYDAEMDRHHPARLTLLGELRQAIEQEQFVLYYQPKIALGSNCAVGAEALVRWQHPSGRMIMPETFIPLLEQTGLIRSLTTWAIGEALRTSVALRARGFNLPIAVNISIRDLQDPAFIDELAEQLATHKATPDWLELELTENAMMADVGGVLEMLSRLAALGLPVVLDDFGTGHSSLAYLKRLPIKMVKVDKSFVMGMARDQNDAAIVNTSIALAHNLGLKVVAEGVDDPDALHRLREAGCDAVQGLYLSRPLSADEYGEWLGKSHWGFTSGAKFPTTAIR
ncbi:MAG: EAL domain-containing protein [Gammaproteobacteria bacterium]|nr:EAL domain-containing protein [Gammaproteobacteria bacterium]